VKYILVLCAAYLAAGALWAVYAGADTTPLRHERKDSGNWYREYYTRPTALLSAYLTTEGYMVVCIEGHVDVDSGRTRFRPKRLAVLIPIKRFWSDPQSNAFTERGGAILRAETQIHVPMSFVTDGCPDKRLADVPITINRPEDPSPHDFFDGIDQAAMQAMRVQAGHRFELYESLISSDGATFGQYKEIVCIGETPNFAGDHASLLIIDVRPSSDKSMAARWVVAMAHDVALWPAQLLGALR
jgi:hypothetical protein